MKYKLIKTYPGSPKTLGLEIHNNGPFWQSKFCVDNVEHFHKGFSEFNPNQYPEFWEKVVEKDYEILTFIQTEGISKGWVTPPDYAKRNYDFYINNYVYKIHSVKRLSDGEIFTVGDNTTTGIIKEFIFRDDCIGMVTCEHTSWVGIKVWRKVKQPLFTTEDGVDIYEGDIFYIAYEHKGLDARPCKANKHYGKLLCKTFSTYEKAEEYKLLNTPCLSINDLKLKFPLAEANCHDRSDWFSKIHIEDLIDIVKAKNK
jgi:hypothetical protein